MRVNYLNDEAVVLRKLGMDADGEIASLNGHESASDLFR